MFKNNKLYELFSGFKKKQIFICILISVEISVSAYIPFLIKDLIDTITYNNNINKVISISEMLFIITILHVIILKIENYYWHKLRLESVNYLRLKMFESALVKPKSFFDNKSIGEILAMIMDDTSIAAQNIVIGMPMLFSNIVNLIIVVCVLLSLNVKLTIITLSILPIYIVWFNHLNKKLRKTSKSERENFGMVMKDAEEKLQAVDTIKVFKMESFMTKIFKNKLDSHFKYVKKNLFYNNLGSGLTRLITSLLPILILTYGSILITKRQLSLGALIAFYTYMSNIYEPLSNLSDYNLGLQTSLAVSDRIIDFLELNIIKDTGKINISNFKSIEFKNMSFGYEPNKLIFKDFNFKINKGDHVGIVGKSGCGKSTFLKLLLGMYPANSGQILINDIDIRDVNISSLYSMISIQEQVPFIFDGTLEENLVLNSPIKRTFLNKIADAMKVSEIGSFNKKISLSNLSVGQMQRICMARALLKNSEILIFDEPTAALDLNLEKQIQNNLKYLTSDKTVILVTHRTELLKDFNVILDLEYIINGKSKNV
ncbi:ABC transporter ATP-binding protein [Clostridium sp. JN-9]|uniref:ABC transporter ATP-binding protein n=1 Tax=Clostridium sp. JN-9 TaxID=2507159 RepID=UPI000FFE1AE6|nr:ABC transporter ATP-binding protein [Clostridium sp. JN-9]QAT40296.1 ABC transporter ATP-binding protein [Clostridium sp. JN-9]